MSTAVLGRCAIWQGTLVSILCTSNMLQTGQATPSSLTHVKKLLGKYDRQLVNLHTMIHVCEYVIDTQVICLWSYNVAHSGRGQCSDTMTR